jgi:FAD/FMN-containing dehydrogenase
MELLRPDHSRYDEARALFNAMIDKRPAVIAECGSAADVRAALELAATEGLEVAVRAGGHSVAGLSTNDGGIVVDVRPMRAIEVDAARRTARVGAGVTWGEFDRATQEHGLATTGGRVSTTGVAGFTLGGGSGWAERAFGLACDNLVSVDLVTADGRELTASEKQNPELFWALHGGGGNFGVATALEFELHPLGPVVMAGLMLWPAEQAAEVSRYYRDEAFDAPDALGSGLVLLSGPPEEFVPAHLQGQPCIALAALWVGDPDEGRAYVKGFRDLKPAVDLVGPMPYADFQCMIDDPPGMQNYWTADYHSTFPDAALDIFVRSGISKPSLLSQQILFPWGGAVARVPEGSTPMTKRDSTWLTHPFAVWEDPKDDAANIAWARSFRDEIAGYTNGGIYLNFIGAEGDDRVRAAYGDANYARLAQVKAEYDPGNLFRGNQNIRPAT